MKQVPFMVQPRVAPKYHAFFWDGLPYSERSLQRWARENLDSPSATVRVVSEGRGAAREGFLCRLLMDGQTFLLENEPCWLVLTHFLGAYTIQEFQDKFKIAESQ